MTVQEAIKNLEYAKIKEHNEENRMALILGIDALEMQVPKNPYINENAKDKDGNPLIRCQDCGYILWNMERYCPYCGQRLTKE